jgi:hypothetical protein
MQSRRSEHLTLSLELTSNVHAQPRTVKILKGKKHLMYSMYSALYLLAEAFQLQSLHLPIYSNPIKQIQCSFRIPRILFALLPTLPLLPYLHRLHDHRMRVSVLAPTRQPRRVRNPEIAHRGRRIVDPRLAPLSIPRKLLISRNASGEGSRCT